MKKLALFFFSLFIFFFAGFSVSYVHPRIANLFQKPKNPQNFTPCSYPLKNHAFVILVIGQNNGSHVDKTLRSILSQNYENFRVIYIDDASSDGSFLQARDTIYESGRSEKVLLMQNDTPFGEDANVVHVANSCADDEILVIVNGEDFLSHEWVLQTLNQYYANPDLWMSFGGSLEFPSFVKEDSPHHLKTFYASLVKKIPEEAVDMSYMSLLLQTAEGHTQHLDEILYLITKGDACEP